MAFLNLIMLGGACRVLPCFAGTALFIWVSVAGVYPLRVYLFLDLWPLLCELSVMRICTPITLQSNLLKTFYEDFEMFWWTAYVASKFISLCLSLIMSSSFFVKFFHSSAVWLFDIRQIIAYTLIYCPPWITAYSKFHYQILMKIIPIVWG